MEDKEKIIIDDIEEKVNILFECNHVDEVQAYKMIENGIEINPENAPICNFKIKIVSNTKSPYGFYTIFQKDPKKDKWEYMGIGNSGASSLITALLKAHEMGLKRISDLEKRIVKHSDEIEGYCNRLADKDQELKTLCEAFEIECLKNTKTGEVTYRSNKLLRKEQECEKLQEQISKIKEYVRHNMFDVDCENWFEIFIYTFEDWKKSILENENKYKKECEKYKQVLNEIEQHCNEQNLKYDTTACEILNIINKAKDTTNE